MGEQKATEEPVSKLPTGKEHFSLYLRAPHWITDRETSAQKIKQLNNRITEVRFPRQKSVHFCYVEFVSAEDRDKALQEMQAIPKKQKITVTRVTKDKPAQLKKHIEKVQKKREAKKEVIALLKEVSEKDSKKANAKRTANVSSKVSIINVPRETTINELKNDFPLAINISLDYPAQKNLPGKALLTYATPGDAVTDSKRSVELHGVELKLRNELNQGGVQSIAARRRGRNRAAARGVDKKDGEEKIVKGPLKKTNLPAIKEEKTAPKNAKVEKTATKSKRNAQQASGGAVNTANKRAKRGAPSNSDEIKIYN